MLHKNSNILLTNFRFLHFDVGICSILYTLGMFYIYYGKQLKHHSVSFYNVEGAFVSFDTFLV